MTDFLSEGQYQSELYKLRNRRAAIGIAEVDEIDTALKFAHVELGVASCNIHHAHLAASHVEDTDLSIAVKHKRHLFVGGIGIEANHRCLVLIDTDHVLANHSNIVDFP